MIDTFSTFYYGIKITSTNRFINFNEGAGELSASINIGSYSLTEFLIEIQSALNVVGSLVYTVSVNRDSRQITISTTANFDLLITSGSQIGSSAFGLMGFTGADVTGATSHISNNGAGSTYEPQYLVQDYIDNGFKKEKVQSSVNESGSGALEIVTFGDRVMIEMTFKFINDSIYIPGYLKKNPSSVSETLTFLNDIIGRGPLEFIKDINSKSSFLKVVLEKTPSSSDGVGFHLKEMSEIQGFYEIGPLVFRVL